MPPSTAGFGSLTNLATTISFQPVTSPPSNCHDRFGAPFLHQHSRRLVLQAFLGQTPSSSHPPNLFPEFRIRPAGADTLLRNVKSAWFVKTET
jgi:hypothetical protein